MKSPSTTSKIVAPENIEKWASEIREAGKTIATLNGSFDLMHAGHLHIIFEAAKQADVLIVALNSDSSIRQYKSATRPIVGLEERLQMVAAIGVVDAVTWFDETDPLSFLKRAKPDVHVNGEEYGKDCVESTVVDTVHLVKRVPGLSTSELIERIKSCD